MAFYYCQRNVVEMVMPRECSVVNTLIWVVSGCCPRGPFFAGKFLLLWVLPAIAAGEDYDACVI